MMNSIKHTFIIATILCLLSVNAYSQHHQDDIIGIWLTPGNLSAIRIYNKGNCYFGKIVWAKEPNDEHGEPKKDEQNPDPQLRQEPLIGLVIMSNLCFNGDREWVKGHIYNPESGNTYKIKVELLNKNTLNVRGYIGVSLIGKTSVWRRKM